jgi:hypothetical protein
LVRDREVCVPDLAGWRRERLAELPRDQRFEVVPDWVCEIVSPSTESKDREIKMPIYARCGVPFAWLFDPLKRTVEAFVLGAGDWQPPGIHQDEEAVTLPPFEALPLEAGASGALGLRTRFRHRRGSPSEAPPPLASVPRNIHSRRRGCPLRIESCGHFSLLTRETVVCPRSCTSKTGLSW